MTSLNTFLILLLIVIAPSMLWFELSENQIPVEKLSLELSKNETPKQELEAFSPQQKTLKTYSAGTNTVHIELTPDEAQAVVAILYKVKQEHYMMVGGEAPQAIRDYHAMQEEKISKLIPKFRN